ncbi:MAG TPA: F0F1 ATP synthase subunit A [Paracoccaceae bacterium]|nr:F0F1 ATP synthase subunit A [Paracoccaceae bacterium]
MTLGPDETVLLQVVPGVAITATLAWTWAIMAALTLISAIAGTRLSAGDERPSRLRTLVEATVETIRGQIAAIGVKDPDRYLPFVGTLFLFIAAANLLAPVPGYTPPTASLSTTAALALCVLAAVPVFAVTRKGIVGFLRSYLQPTPFMLPFNIIGELSRTLALAVRLYGNMMSGTVIAAILLSVAPLFFPVLMQLLGLLTGMIQAYIFAVLAMVYIASAAAAGGRTGGASKGDPDGE